MKHKKVTKKLSLKKATITNLDLNKVKGGLPLWTYEGCAVYTDPGDGCSQCSMCNTAGDICNPDTDMCSGAGACVTGDWTLCPC
jgi:hypothetical protein